MEEGLLLKEVQISEEEVKGRVVIEEEVKRVISIACPMVIVVMSQNMLQVISLMMVGRLGELFLSSSALALSIAAVTGFSPLLGMASALETLSGQAYGARQYKKMGTQTYTAIFSLTLVCIPISILLINMDKLLIFIGQDPLISREAGKFSTCLVPAIFAYAILQPLVRYFQVQSLVIPMLISSVITLCLHVLVCWVLVFKSSLSNLGAAVAVSLSMWVNVVFLALYMKFSASCALTRSRVSLEMFHGIGEFFRFAVPSAVMICLESWSFELMILLSGLLPHPELETSVLSVCLTTIITLYAIPNGIVAAASTRVSNELGAGNPQRARIAAYVVTLITLVDGVIVGSILFATRRVFGYAFSQDKEVVDYVTTMAPLICINVILDSLQGVLSGVVRGCGRQHIGVFVNIGAFYLFGIPIAVILCFWVQMRGIGLWTGILCGTTLQSLLLLIITGSTNWEHEASKARKRLSKPSSKFVNEANVDEQITLS